MPYKLLLADDSVTIQRVIELTFADEDIQVLAVGDGKKAIASVQSEHPDIVLADVGMPERDGYEVASFIKTTAEFSHIPVLLLTGAFEPIDEARARAVGCDGVLVKPFEPQMVINRVKDLLAGRRSGGPLSAAPAPAVPAASANRGVASAPTAVPAGSLEDYFDRLDAAFASMEGPTSPAVPEHPQAPPGARQPAEAAAPAQRPSAAPQPSSLPQGIADWDPDLTGDPEKPAAVDPPFAASHPPAPYVSGPYRSAETTAAAEAELQSYSAPPAAEASAAAHEPAQPAAAGADSAQPVPAQTAARAAPPAARSSAAPHPAGPVPTPPAVPAPPAPTLAEAFAALLSAEQARPITPSALGGLPDTAVDEIVERVVARMSDAAVRETVVDVAERLVREEIARIKSA